MALQKGVSRTITWDMLTTAGAADTTTTPTVTVSKDGGSFAASTNAAARIGATNVFSLVLTATEWTADLVTVQATGAGCVPRTLSFLTEADYTTTKAGYLDIAVSSRLATSGYTAPTNADTSGVTTLLTRLPQTLQFTGANVNANAQVVADKAGYTASASNLPTDYQQRGVAVTLPTLPNVTVGGYATGQDPATLTWGAGARTLTDKTGFSGTATNFVAAPSAVSIRQEIDANSTQLAAILTALGAIPAGGLTTGQAAALSDIQSKITTLLTDASFNPVGG